MMTFEEIFNPILTPYSGLVWKPFGASADAGGGKKKRRRG